MAGSWGRKKEGVGDGGKADNGGGKKLEGGREKRGGSMIDGWCRTTEFHDWFPKDFAFHPGQ